MKNHDELMSAIIQKANIKKVKIKKQKKVFISSLISLCLVLTISVGAVKIISTDNNPYSSLITTPPENIDTSLKGLSVDNYMLSEIKINIDNRNGIKKLSDFFSTYTPDMFVFVRVFDTKQWIDKIDGVEMLKQASSAYVLSSIWSKNIEISQTIVITQSLYGGCLGQEKTNMLRKDAVYLLPLVQRNDELNVYGDLDVLFEVDDCGTIWSHSNTLNSYDGKDASILSDDIVSMTSNNNFAAAITSFGYIARESGILAEAKVITVNKSMNSYGKVFYEYTLGEVKILSSPDYVNKSPKDNKIYAVSYESEPLTEGMCYLLMAYKSDNQFSIESNRTAVVNENRTISPLKSQNNNIFAQFNGYSVEQMQIQAEKAKEWYSEFVSKEDQRIIW